MAYYGI